MNNLELYFPKLTYNKTRVYVNVNELPSRRAVTEEGPNESIRGDATDEGDPGPVARRAAQQRHRTLTDKEGRNKERKSYK